MPPVLSLPLPYSSAERHLGPLHLGTLAAIRRGGLVVHGRADELIERVTGLPAIQAGPILDHLAAQNLILRHQSDALLALDCPRFVRTSLRSEKDRNRKRSSRGKPSEWPISDTIRRHFPATCPQPVRTDSRPVSYLLPSVFEPLLKKFPHSHLKQRPVNGEVIAGPYLPADFPMLVRLLEEKMTMGFRLHLLYTRKSVSVARLH